MRSSSTDTWFAATGSVVASTPEPRRWNLDGPIILAETGTPTEVGDPMPVTCVCGGMVVIDPVVASVPLERFEDGLLETAGLTRTARGWRGNLGLDGVAHLIEHRDHTVAAITSMGELQPGRDIWTHHGVVEVVEVPRPSPPGDWSTKAIAIAAVAAVVAFFVWLNVSAIVGYLGASELERSGTIVTADVIDLRESSGPRQADLFTVTYRYSDAQGNSHTAEASVDENRHLLASLAGTLDIAYDPTDPATSTVVDNDQPGLRLGLAIVIDLVVAGLIATGLRSASHRSAA